MTKIAIICVLAALVCYVQGLPSEKVARQYWPQPPFGFGNFPGDHFSDKSYTQESHKTYVNGQLVDDKISRDEIINNDGVITRRHYGY